MTTADHLSSSVLAELDHVYDPEVDEPVTQMGFIREVEVKGAGVVVHMQLPQFFCAPNFTYLMVDDVRRAAEKVVGAGRVEVSLDGHFEADKINGARSGTSFADVFADAVDDLDTLRDRFARKKFLIRQERVCKELDKQIGQEKGTGGVLGEELLEWSLADVAGHGLGSYARYLVTREELGIDTSPDAPFLVAADGVPVEPDKLRLHRRSASVMAISFEGNGMMCKALIHERYPDSTRPPTAEITSQEMSRGEVA
ncbi:MAG: iron-sulfur cluster assembly protein [Nocardioides sp.]